MSVKRLAIGLSAALALAGCNMLTGADQFVIDDESSPDGSNGGGPTDGQGGSGATTSSGAGSQGGSTGEGAGDPLGETAGATGYNVREVAFYQAVKSTVFANGNAQSPSVRLVADRPAVVRVFVDTAGTTGAPVTARLTIGANPPLDVPAAASYASNDADYGSTINFDVPAGYMKAGQSWKVELLESTDTATGNPSALTPEKSLAVEATHAVKVTIIPVMYQADGSNRMPDTSQSQLDRYQAYFMTLYPASSVTVSVGNTLQWGQSIGAGGDGWDSLLNELSDVRASSGGAAFDEYYYGVFEPSNSFEQFCGGGCVAGLGFIGDPGGEYSRAAIGLGYGGDVAAWTAVHEVGHNHGRPHSPCGGVAGPDPGYPHSGGDIGVWGMDIFGHQMVEPSYKDFMGYCEPTWISDYVYENILDFMQQTGGAQSFHIPEEELDQEWERIAVGGSDASSARFLAPLKMKRPPTGSARTVSITREDGTSAEIEGRFYAYDHLPGGVMFVKKQSNRIVALDAALEIGGMTRAIRATR